MSSDTYTPPKVWKWEQESGGRFNSINRPIAGPTHEKELPVGYPRRALSGKRPSPYVRRASGDRPQRHY